MKSWEGTSYISHRPPRAGKYIARVTKRRMTLKPGDRVISPSTGETGTVVECFTETVAVLTTTKLVISGPYDSFIPMGNRYASH